ncbi:MAG: hypothetical protein WCP39_00760 [Chlamydiota bacterium]
MKSLFTLFILLITNAFTVFRVDPSEKKGFCSLYFFYIPKTLQPNATLLVIPNNTGFCQDDSQVHIQSAKRTLQKYRSLADSLQVILLCPAFPRPKSSSNVYTHALARAVFTVEEKALQRLDLQLIAMIEDLEARLKARKISIDKKVLLLGFSASGMFVNRFVFLHPDWVKGAVIGSPGGWPLMPLATYKNEKLTYPVGVFDMKLLTGTEFLIKKVQEVPLFFFLGSQDRNDSVTFSDSYTLEQRKQIFYLFGKTPQERWFQSQLLCQQLLPLANFRLYDGIGHEISDQMKKDIEFFFCSLLAEKPFFSYSKFSNLLKSKKLRKK